MISGVATTKCAYIVATPNMNCVYVLPVILASLLQIELALAPFCSKLAELGRPYKMLRALRWVVV